MRKNFASRAAEGAIGFNGFGFVFRDIKTSNSLYITVNLSSKICRIGAFRDFVKRLEDRYYKTHKLEVFLLYDEMYRFIFCRFIKNSFT